MVRESVCCVKECVVYVWCASKRDGLCMCVCAECIVYVWCADKRLSDVYLSTCCVRGLVCCVFICVVCVCVLYVCSRHVYGYVCQQQKMTTVAVQWCLLDQIRETNFSLRVCIEYRSRFLCMTVNKKHFPHSNVNKYLRYHKHASVQCPMSQVCTAAPTVPKL